MNFTTKEAASRITSFGMNGPSGPEPGELPEGAEEGLPNRSGLSAAPARGARLQPLWLAGALSHAARMPASRCAHTRCRSGGLYGIALSLAARAAAAL